MRDADDDGSAAAYGSRGRASRQRSRGQVSENPRPPWDCTERTHRGTCPSWLGRVYALQGDTANARVAYNDFLTLWKDADLEILIFIAAKSEYAKLK
jgi:hypothetical protein